MSSKVTEITESLIEAVAVEAAASPRQRKNYNFHDGPTDNPHRFLNIFLKGTYVRPHRHLDPPKAETFIILEGEAELIVFDDDGAIVSRHVLGRVTSQDKSWGIDLPVGVWHTIIALTDRAVCFEVKPGPWDPASDKDFAPWAPAEGSPDAAEYLKGIGG